MIQRDVIYRDGTGGFLMPMVVYGPGSIQGRDDTVIYQAHMTHPPDGITEINMSLVSYSKDYDWSIFEKATEREDRIFRLSLAGRQGFVGQIIMDVILEQTGFESVPC